MVGLAVIVAVTEVVLGNALGGVGAQELGSATAAGDAALLVGMVLTVHVSVTLP